MYCERYNHEITAQAKFCANCGSPTSKPLEKESSSYPILTLKPVFISHLSLLAFIPAQIFFTLWGSGFFGGFSFALIKAFNLNLPNWFTFVFFACIFFFGIPIIAYITKKKAYSKTKYQFYNTKMDYYEGFFSIEEKTINYDKITEVSLRKGIFQKKYNLGTIFLSTPATGQNSKAGRSGIAVVDIKNPDQVYQKVKELISRGS